MGIPGDQGGTKLITEFLSPLISLGRLMIQKRSDLFITLRWNSALPGRISGFFRRNREDERWADTPRTTLPVLYTMFSNTEHIRLLQTRDIDFIPGRNDPPENHYLQLGIQAGLQRDPDRESR